MAETYRGLTIRIGGDTTKLTQALHSSNQAITGTQSAMRKLSEAMRLDPSSFSAAKMQAGALADQASNTATRLATLNDAIRSIGDEVRVFDGVAMPVKDLAESWTNVNMQASLTRDYYKDLTATLATTYAQFTKTYDEASKLASVKMTESWDLSKTGLEQMLADVEKMKTEFNANDGQVEKFSNRITKLHDQYAKLAEEYQKYQRAVATETDVAKFTKAAQKLEETRQKMEGVRQSFQSYIESFNGFNSEEIFKFDEDNTDLASLAKALYECVKAERLSSEEADGLYDSFARMKDMWKQAFENVQTANVVEGFQDLEAESEKAAAKVKSLVDEMVRLAGTSDTAKSLGETNDKIAEIDERYKSAVESIKRINGALKTDPKNVELLAAKSRAVADAQELAAQKAALLQQKIDAYKSDKVQALATSTQELASRVSLVTESYKNAASSLNAYEVMIGLVTQRLNKLKSEDKVDTSEYKDLTAQLGLLKEAAERAQQAFDDAKESMQEPLEASELRELLTLLEEWRVEAENVANVNATPKIDEAAFMQSVNMISNAMRRLAGEVITSADTVDSAYRDMRKTVNGTESQFESLLDAAIKFSQTSITSADTMLEMQALGGQLGVLVEDLEQFGRITSSLDIATDMDAEDIALRLGQVANVLNLDIDGMQGFSDALVRLGNNMPAQESAIMNVAQRLAAVASTANFSGAEILAWSAAIASTGQRSEAAATAIGNTISGIESAVAAGGDDIEAFARIAGKSAEDFKKAWNESPTDALRSFLEGLQDINKNGDSAVAALEEMGITGVRQQQTLLGLSKTVDSLDKSLQISTDAWNQISDEWGQAGDAANEAQKKSAGFSGALAIMQNNASNLAASLGDGFIPAMNLASDVMRVITDVLNSIPAPMKTAIVSIGGIATVIGTVVPVMAQFSKGWAAAAQMAVNSGGTFGALVSKLTGLEAGATSAAAATGTLSVAMTALSTVGIAAFLTALTFAVSSISDVIEKQQQLEMATTGLESAMANSGVAYDEYVAGSQNATVSTRDLITETENLIAKQAELAQQMSDMWGEIGTNEAIVDSYVQKMIELSDKTSLTKEEQAELNAVVSAFNDMTGSTVEIMDESTGALKQNKDEIEDIADAWKNSAEVNGAMEQYLASTKQLAEDTAELERIEAMLGDTSANASGWFTDMRDGANSVSGEYMGLSLQAENLRASIASATASQQEAISIMSSSEVSVAHLKAAIEASGYSLSDYANITAQQWSRIAAVYGTNVSKAIEELNRLARAQKTTTAYSPASTTGGGVVDNSAAKKQLQRENDAAYKEAQKNYDRQYKALQKSLNKAYNAEKKNLDNIYKERKKQYDAQLKLLKDAQDDEIDAFNKATDAKLKEMEREYKARVKQLEDEFGITDIDDQIEALEAETEAEKRALEERKQQEKVADLQAAVDKAKSRRKQAEAQKALNDYLEEIGVKHNEQTRKDQIEALKKQKEDLKDELDARKEQLKEQYDAEVEAYKEARAEELDALKDANQAAYDLQKEKYDTLLEQLKESQSEQLEALKEAQSEQLEAMKDSQQEALQAMKNDQQDALDALNEGASSAGDIIDSAEDDILSSLEEAYAKAKEEMQAAAPDVKDKFKELVGDIAEETAKIPVNMQQHAQDGTKNLRDELGNSIQPTRTRVDELRATLDNGLSPIPGNFDTYGRDATRNLMGRLSDSVNPTGRNADEIARAINAPIGRLPQDVDPSVRQMMMTITSGIASGGVQAEQSSRNVATNIQGTFSGMGGGSSYSWGYDFLMNFNSGVVSVWNNYLFPNIQNIARTVTAWLGHSVPDKGPLRDDDKWGGDFVMNLVNGMHDKESDLYKQVKRMAEIVEDGFNPDMSLDAAYEAVNGIRSKAGRQAQAAAGTATTINLNMSLDVSNVSVRSDQDIDRLADEISKRMAAAAARQLAGRL